MFKSLIKIIPLVLSLFACSVWATSVESLLKEKQAPAGVVFEIVSSDLDLLGDLMPELQKDIRRLREQFPGIPVAIVAHGSEQFALTTKGKKTHKQAHETVEALVKNEDVDVHVCGTHASWYNVMPEDFPDYVDVTPAGPTQINDYEEMGYELVVLP